MEQIERPPPSNHRSGVFEGRLGRRQQDRESNRQHPRQTFVDQKRNRGGERGGAGGGRGGGCPTNCDFYEIIQPQLQNTFLRYIPDCLVAGSPACLPASPTAFFADCLPACLPGSPPTGNPDEVSDVSEQRIDQQTHTPYEALKMLLEVIGERTDGGTVIN